MVKRKPSGVINMNYSYKIKNNEITEYDNQKCRVIEIWHIDSLKARNFKNFGGDLRPKLKYISDSYQRTKEWIQENHPELLI